MQKIILYYKFTPVQDTEAVMFWQRALCQKLDLKGRIIIAPHGINGTLGGDIDNLKKYIKETKSFKSFKGTKFKWSEGGREDFPRLSVKVRSEIVSFGVADKISVNEKGIIGGGKHIKPEKLHELIKEKGKEVVFFDGRNAYESEIGRFKAAVTPKVNHSRDFPKELKSSKYDSLKDKTVVTYCTGGIRCEVLSMLMKQEGFKDVYQIDGGVVKYGETFKDKGLWRGKLFVFDKRMATEFSSEGKDIGKCIDCYGATSNYVNCFTKTCNKLILLCIECSSKGQKYCTSCSIASASII